jgi:hypothetical protein
METCFVPLTIGRETAVIHLTRGYHALVDTADWEWLNQWKWNALVHRLKYRTYVYARRSVGRKVRMKMHTQITGAGPGQEVDHRNHNTLDNRRANLLVTDRDGNSQNVRKPRGRGRTSRYIGVCRMKGRWVAQAVGPNGVQLKLGAFDSEIEAARVRDAYVLRHYKNPMLNLVLECRPTH